MVKKNLNLGILLNLGENFHSLQKSGQDVRFINEYLKRYAKYFTIYIFSYTKDQRSLPNNCFILENKLSLHRFIYQFFLPFYYSGKIKKINAFRVMQLTGIIPAILINIFYNKPFVFTYGYDYFTFAKLEGQKIKPLLLKLLELIAMKFASNVIVTTKPIQQYLQKKYPNINLVYIPNGVDIGKFKPGQSTINQPADATHQALLAGNKQLTIKILFVGRLEKQKNLESLIKAVGLLNSKFKIQLLFIGQGSLKDQLITLAKSLKVDLEIINKVSHDKIVQYYQQADIFILPSFLEGHPKALLEAMACGLPCLVGNYPGVSEFKNEREVLIIETDPPAIAYGLERLLDDKKLMIRLSKQGRQKIIDCFNIEKLLNLEINLLKNLASKGRS